MLLISFIIKKFFFYDHDFKIQHPVWKYSYVLNKHYFSDKKCSTDKRMRLYSIQTDPIDNNQSQMDGLNEKSDILANIEPLQAMDDPDNMNGQSKSMWENLDNFNNNESYVGQTTKDSNFHKNHIEQITPSTTTSLIVNFYVYDIAKNNYMIESEPIETSKMNVDDSENVAQLDINRFNKVFERKKQLRSWLKSAYCIKHGKKSTSNQNDCEENFSEVINEDDEDDEDLDVNDGQDTKIDIEIHSIKKCKEYFINSYLEWKNNKEMILMKKNHLYDLDIEYNDCYSTCQNVRENINPKEPSLMEYDIFLKNIERMKNICAEMKNISDSLKDDKKLLIQKQDILLHNARVIFGKECTLENIFLCLNYGQSFN